MNGLFILADGVNSRRFQPGGETLADIVQRLFRGRFVRRETWKPAVHHHPRAPPRRPPPGTGDGVIEKQPLIAGEIRHMVCHLREPFAGKGGVANFRCGVS